MANFSKNRFIACILGCYSATAECGLLFSGGGDKEIMIWDVLGRRLLAKLSGHTGDVNRLLFTPGETALLSASDDGTIRIWRVLP